MCIDHSYVFNTVCHMLALVEEDKLSDSIANLLLTMLVIEPNKLPDHPESINKQIEDAFGFRLSTTQIREAIDHLIFKNHLSVEDNRLVINAENKIEINAFIRSARQIEENARRDWLTELSKLNEYQPDWNTDLWSCLQDYIGNVLRRYGVRTRQLLDPTSKIDSGDASKTLEEMFEEAYKKHTREIPYDFVSKAITIFFSNATSFQVDYTTELINGTLTFFALVTDHEFASYINKTMMPISVFVDTNIIFSLVGLHSQELNQISTEILSIANKNTLPFKFLVHPITLLEYKHAIEFYGNKIKLGHPWNPTLSRAAISNGHLSSIERKYHEMNAEARIDPDVFLDRYGNPEELLRIYGFEIYNPSNEQLYDKDTEYKELVNNYKTHIETQYPSTKFKRTESLEHDITLLQTARKHRKDGIRILEGGCMCLSIDMTLYTFDWYESYENNPRGVVIFPNQLIQLLIPLTSMTNDFKKHFIQTIALPQFRVIGTDYSEVKRKVMVYLNNFENLPIESAQRILVDSYLLRRLKAIPENANEQFEDLVEMAITIDNQRLQLENEKLNILIKEYENRLINYNEVVNANTEILNTNKNLSAKYKKASFINRLTIGLITCAILLFCAFFLPNILNWSWFINHVNRTSILTAVAIIILCITWLIIDEDKKRRRFILGSIALPVLFIIIEAMD